MTESTTLTDLAAPVAAALGRFPPVRGHLDAATSRVPSLEAVAATREAVTACAEGRIDGPGFDSAVERSRTAFAQLVGADPADVAAGRPCRCSPVSSRRPCSRAPM